MLIIFSGLPGVGKTTIARQVALKLKATLLRIDSLEQALLRSGLVPNGDLGPAGYMTAYALAADNLRLGLTVLADSVNPIALTRDAWRQVALDAQVAFLEIEVICSDQKEHRRRVEMRRPDLPGFILPTWTEVLARDYQTWDRERLVLDTANLSVAQAVEAVYAASSKIEASSPHRGLDFDDFLQEERLYDEVNARAMKRLLVWQLSQALNEAGLTRADLASRMQTSLAAVSRLLDSENSYFNPQTMDKAARVLGKRLEFQLVE